MRLYVKKFCGAVVLAAFCFVQPACKNQSAEKKEVVAKKDTIMSLSGANPYQTVDQSPMDISYTPVEYPQNKMKGIAAGTPVARVIYSRPHKKGRVIFSNNTQSLCQYGKPWRLGANESTEIDFFQPVMIAGKNIDAGRYVMYCVPHEDKWEIVFNSHLNSWGLHIDRSKDIFSTEVPVQSQTPPLEDFTIIFQDNAQGADLLMAWDNVKVVLPITFSK